MIFRRKPLLFFCWKARRRNPQSCPPFTPSTHVLFFTSHLQDDLAARMPGFDLFVGFLRLL